MLFVFPHALMWHSFAVNLLVVNLQKTLTSGRYKVPLTENRTVGVIPTSQLWGGTSLLLRPLAPKIPVTQMDLHRAPQFRTHRWTIVKKYRCKNVHDGSQLSPQGAARCTDAQASKCSQPQSIDHANLTATLRVKLDTNQ